MMRTVIVGVVLAAFGWVWSAPVGAGSDPPAAHFAQQWRIFPHAPFRRAADEEITARFTRQIRPLVSLFQSNDNEVEGKSVADVLLDDKTRSQFFRLESLLRLYVRAFPDFEKYLASVKEMEDGIGAYSYAVDSLKFAADEFSKENQRAAASPSRLAEQEQILAGLRKKLATARAVFTRLVDSSTLGSDLPELQSQLDSTLVGWPAGRDLEYVNGELVKMLKDVRDNRYNFNQLEDGVHEFRRQLRWFPMYIDALDGLILQRDDPPGACPVPALESMAGTRPATHRYSNPALGFPAAHPCTISRCLMWPVVKTIDEIGRLKDVAEGNAALQAALDFGDDNLAWANKISPEEITRAKALRTDLLSTRALDSLIGQIAACK